MSEDTGSSTEPASVSNGSGLSMMHMRGGLFGKSAATLNDETAKTLSTSIVSENGTSESADNKLCNDEKCDEPKSEKADESPSKLDDSVKIANEDNKSTESHSEEKENAKSDSVDDQQANTSSAENENSSVNESVSANRGSGEAEPNAEGSVLLNQSENNANEGDAVSQDDHPEEEQQEEPDSTTPEQVEEEEPPKLEEVSKPKKTEESINNPVEDSPKDILKSPGRRGRPPRSRAETKTEVEPEEQSTPRTLRARNTEVVTPNKVTKTPKVESTGKRGRPPKLNKIISSPMTTNARRGRRKREETEEPSEKSDNGEETEQEADVSADAGSDHEQETENEVETEPEVETDPVEGIDSDDEVEEIEEPKKTRRGAAKQAVTPKTPPVRSVGRPKRNSTVPTPAAKAESPAKGPGRRPSRRVSAIQESTSTPKRKVEVKVPASAPPARKSSKLNQKDPYDFSPEQETPPVFFKNIEMKLQSFGDVTYSRVGTGKYENTEKAAEARVSNLVDLVPAQKSKKTLAELTPRSAKGKKEEKSTPVTKVESESPKPAKTPKGTPGRKRKQGDSLPTSSPKKAAILAPVLDDREQWVVDHPDDDHLPYEAGARVYAVFNKVLYPAIVLNSGKDSLGRYKVQYVSDKVVKDVPNEGIIPLRALVAEKQCVAQVGSDWMEMQIVQAPKIDDVDEWKKAIFVLNPVDEEDKDEVTTDKYSWASINLDSSDWRDYITKKSREVTEVLVDNISAGDNRVSRRSRAGADKVTSYPPIKPSVKKSKAREEEVMEVDAFDDPPREKFEPIFSGKIFILTSAQRGSDATGFKKKLMSEFIEQCHGVVVEDFMAVEDQRELEPFLISDTCYRTHKYLSALARGIPCVSHEWIEKCREAKSLVDYSSHLLPAGKSILDDQMYPLPKNQRTLLKDKVVLVHSTNRPATPRSLNFYQIWQPMVSWLGGTPLNEIPKNIEIIDFILADNSASPDLIELAVDKGISIASSEWVIQAIIMDKLPNLDSHPRFRYDVSASNHS